MNFNLNHIGLINVLFIAIGIGICLLCILQMVSYKHLRKEVRVYFTTFFSMIIVYITSHLVRELMNGLPGEGARAALYIVTFIEILAAGVMAHMMSLLILSIAKRTTKSKVWDIILYSLLIAHLIILIVGWPFDLIYTFDANNLYARGNFYLLSNLCPVIMMVMCMVLLIKYHKNFIPKIKLAFWIYLVVPIVAVAVQSFLYGLQLIIFATVGCAVYMFSTIIRILSVQFEDQQKEASRIETELTMASSIQSDMLPNIYPAFPERKEFDIFASMDPAKEVGGDFYNFFLVDDDHLCLMIADVSGKGVPAALFMMASMIVLSNNAMLGKSPAKILEDANNTIVATNKEGMFVTVWLGILEISTGKLVASNAGHEYPYVTNKDGKFEMVKDKHGFVIGGMPGAKYTDYTVNLKPGSKFFIYTDGVAEATDSNGELYGFDRLTDALNQDNSDTPQKILKTVRESVDDFVKEAEQFDDITMLCLEYRGK